MLPVFLRVVKIDIQTNTESKVIQNLKVNVNGDKFSVIDEESFFILTTQFEEYLNKYLILREGNVFLDVGAHLGKHTIRAAKKVGSKGTVIAIEAHPANYALLSKNIAYNKLVNVRAYNIAGWNQSKSIKLYEGKSSGRHSLKNELQQSLDNTDPENKTYIVTAQPIDDVVRFVGLKVVFVKVDAGGAEFEILQGLKQTLVCSRPVILVEIIPANQMKTITFLKK